MVTSAQILKKKKKNQDVNAYGKFKKPKTAIIQSNTFQQQQPDRPW